jgi:ribonuclease HI
MQKSFKKVKNVNLWVRGHDGHEQNERCDKLAYDEAQRQIKTTQ